MRIKRLDITGFKSFMERAVFQFDDGITGVVGPNGCGKSNVVDAIRWVMGEQSAKNLRGRGMEDVIFNGSETKAPLSMAEVSMTFTIEPGDQLAPQYAGFPEVTITRRLFRSGESEYLINKTVCRLLDVNELFLGTGVGTKAYSIIEQGRVGLIVSAKPEDRRALIEEAAGITKYKTRRKAAERKMEATQANLLRVTDITNELEKRLEQLQRQAKKAEKYKRLKTDMREIELHVASHRHTALMAERQELLQKLESSSGAERESFDQVQSLEQAIAERRFALDQETEALSQLQAQVHSLESQVQRDEQNLAHWEKDAAETEQRISSARGELETLERRQAELIEAIAAREAELGGLDGNWREDEEALLAAQEQLKQVTLQQASLALTVEQERSALVSLVGRLANHENNLLNLARQRTDLEQRTQKSATEIEALKGQEGEFEKVRAQASDRVEESRQLAAEYAERRMQEEEQLAQTRQAFAENELQVIALREELSDKRSRLSSLEEIQSAYEGFDRGVRSVMAKAGANAREQGIFGLVADVLTVPPRFERAVEAALGERLQAVIVESQGRAFEWIEHLKALSEGRSTFLPMPSGPRAPASSIDLAEPGVVALALNEVGCEEALRPIAELLLSDVVVVENLACASRLAERGWTQTLVTLDGDVLRPDGAVSGGTLEGAAVGALQKKREIAELGTEVARVEERYNEILTRHYALQKQMGQAEGVLKGLEKNRHQEELRLATEEKDFHRAGEELARVRDRIVAVTREHADLSRTLEGISNEEESSRGEVAHGQSEREQREERVRTASAELEALKSRAVELNDSLVALRVKVAGHNERGAAAKKELENLLVQRSEVDERLARAQKLVGEGDGRVGELLRQIEQTRAERTRRAEELTTSRAQLEERRSAHQEQSVQVREQETFLKELRTKVDELTQGLSQLSLRERELALELNHLLEQIRERHQVELEAEIERFKDAALEEGAEEKLRELRSQVERMGEINLTAIDEHTELAQRFEFLSAQKNDLEASQAQLREAIEKIDDTSRERFRQTFDVVNEKFMAVFPRLFGGGRAGMVLTNDGPGMEPGIDIVAQPPGKKLQSVNLLSGGEKALTAVALIFGIFLIKPTPFCLLDEVDAPLDEGNVGRYNEMVREMSRQSQFILITHNKRTMEIANSMYGVTMQEPGISSLVAVRLKEAEARAANDDAAVA